MTVERIDERLKKLDEAVKAMTDQGATVATLALLTEAGQALQQWKERQYA